MNCSGLDAREGPEPFGEVEGVPDVSTVEAPPVMVVVPVAP